MQTFGPFLARQVRFHQFCGFYESYLSSELDHQEGYQAEYLAGDKQDEDGIPAELRLTEEDFADILFDCADYGQMHEDMAEAYAEALDDLISNWIDMPAGVVFHSLWSPREYNYGSDQLDVWISEPTLRNLMVRSLANGHAMLAAVIKETFTARSGFSPSYSADIDDWIGKPLAEWDEIELGILLEAVYAIGRDRDEDPLDKAATYALCEGEASYCIMSNNIDWTKVDEKVAEKRAELEEEHRATIDPNYVPPPVRCGSTIDMFQERYAA